MIVENQKKRISSNTGNLQKRVDKKSSFIIKEDIPL